MPFSGVLIGVQYFPLVSSDYDEFGHDEFSFGNRTVANGVDKEGPVLSKLGSSSTAELHPKTEAQGESKPTSMPPASVMTRLILIMVWRKLIRNPNTYSSLIGLTWSLISFKYAIFTFSFTFIFKIFLVLVLGVVQPSIYFLIFNIVLQVECCYACNCCSLNINSI